MSDLNGCEYFAYNATDQEINGTIYEHYENKKTTELKLQNLNKGTATPPVRFNCGSSHHVDFEYESTNGTKSLGSIKLSEDNTVVSLVFYYNSKGEQVMQISKPSDVVTIN